MTLIAAWKEQGTPVLIGDLIVSTDGINVMPHVSLPTRDDVERLLPQEYYYPRIVETCQKAYKISDNFVLGWTGAKLAAKGVIKALLGRYGGKQVSLQEIKEYLRKIDGWDVLNCVIIGWVYEEQQATAFKWDSAKP